MHLALARSLSWETNGDHFTLSVGSENLTSAEHLPTWSMLRFLTSSASHAVAETEVKKLKGDKLDFYHELTLGTRNLPLLSSPFWLEVASFLQLFEPAMDPKPPTCKTSEPFNPVVPPPGGQDPQRWSQTYFQGVVKSLGHLISLSYNNMLITLI